MTRPQKWVLSGHLVPLVRSRPRHTFPGRLYIEGDTIVARRAAGDAAPPGFDGARIVDCGKSYIYPGLIDLHSHIGYNALPLWTHDAQAEPYLHHDIWPNRDTYQPKVGWPAWVQAKAAPESLMTYVQVRALVGGTTTIQGWPTINRKPANQLVRNADDQAFDGNEDPVYTSALTLDRPDLRSKADRLEQGKGFIYHCSEGQATSRVTSEFDDLRATNCLREGLVAIHLTAVGDTQFAQWATQARNEGDAGPGALVWSPFSNLWLYGETTKVPEAVRNDITVCLGTDWGPSGTKNLLGELKVARLVSDAAGWGLSDYDLVEMVTANPGDTMARFWGRTVGRFHTDSLADIVVVSRRRDDPWENLVSAREEDIRLVVVGGQATYGTDTVMRAAGERRTSSVTVGRARKRVVLTDPADKDEPVEERRRWYFSRALNNLNEVRSAPREALAAPVATAAAAGITDGGFPDDWLVIELDMPGGLGLVAGPPPDDADIVIPRLPSMAHDRTWLQSLKDRGFHEGLLDKMARFYPSGN